MRQNENFRDEQSSDFLDFSMEDLQCTDLFHLDEWFFDKTPRMLVHQASKIFSH